MSAGGARFVRDSRSHFYPVGLIFTLCQIVKSRLTQMHDDKRKDDCRSLLPLCKVCFDSDALS